MRLTADALDPSSGFGEEHWTWLGQRDCLYAGRPLVLNAASMYLVVI
jgi:hypothetical protein